MEAHKNGAEVCAALAEGTKRAFQSLVADKRRQSLEQQQQPVVTTNGASGENDGSPP
uniref:Uncharacterized protein n=1 Tax=Plectus sambesii TaxID=2011161 RepID=A0A914VY97_9BILA